MERDAPGCGREPLKETKNRHSLRWRRLAVSTGGGSTHEHLAPVQILDKNSNAFTLAALGLIGEDFDLSADGYACFCDAVAEQIGRRSALDAPIDDFAVGTFHIHPDPGVGVDQFHFCDLTLQIDRPVLIKRRSEGVMRLEWSRGEEQTSDKETDQRDR